MTDLLLIDCKTRLVKRFSPDGDNAVAKLPDTQDAWLPTDLNGFRVFGSPGAQLPDEHLVAPPAPKGAA